MVRLSEQLHNKFTRAIDIYGGNRSAVIRNLVSRWADDVIIGEVIMSEQYGFKKGDRWLVTLIGFNFEKSTTKEPPEFGDRDNALWLYVTQFHTVENFKQIADALGCELVVMSGEVKMVNVEVFDGRTSKMIVVIVPESEVEKVKGQTWWGGGER